MKLGLVKISEKRLLLSTFHSGALSFC